jgi:hypothetical protein
MFQTSGAFLYFTWSTHRDPGNPGNGEGGENRLGSHGRAGPPMA